MGEDEEQLANEPEEEEDPLSGPDAPPVIEQPEDTTGYTNDPVEDEED